MVSHILHIHLISRRAEDVVSGGMETDASDWPIVSLRNTRRHIRGEHTHGEVV